MGNYKFLKFLKFALKYPINMNYNRSNLTTSSIKGKFVNQLIKIK